jgi:hypothetical protein
MVDVGALILAMFLIFVVGNQRFQFQVGRFKPVNANGHFRFIFLFPLGATLSIIAIARLIGHFRPDECAKCSRVSYDVLFTLYPGWALTLIGLFGVKSFATIQERMIRAFIIISTICGPFLIWVGFHDIILQMRSG